MEYKDNQNSAISTKDDDATPSLAEVALLSLSASANYDGLSKALTTDFPVASLNHAVFELITKAENEADILRCLDLLCSKGADPNFQHEGLISFKRLRCHALDARNSTWKSAYSAEIARIKRGPRIEGRKPNVTALLRGHRLHQHTKSRFRSA